MIALYVAYVRLRRGANRQVAAISPACELAQAETLANGSRSSN